MQTIIVSAKNIMHKRKIESRFKKVEKLIIESNLLRAAVDKDPGDICLHADKYCSIFEDFKKYFSACLPTDKESEFTGIFYKVGQKISEILEDKEHIEEAIIVKKIDISFWSLLNNKDTPYMVTQSYFKIGNLYFYCQKKFPEALSYFEKAYKYSLSSNFTTQLKDQLMSLVLASASLGYLNKTRKYLALYESQPCDYQVMIPNAEDIQIYNKLGLIYLKKNRHEDAIEYFLFASDLIREHEEWFKSWILKHQTKTIRVHLSEGREWMADAEEALKDLTVFRKACDLYIKKCFDYIYQFRENSLWDFIKANTIPVEYIIDKNSFTVEFNFKSAEELDLFNQLAEENKLMPCSDVSNKIFDLTDINVKTLFAVLKKYGEMIFRDNLDPHNIHKIEDNLPNLGNATVGDDFARDKIKRHAINEAARKNIIESNPPSEQVDEHIADAPKQTSITWNDTKYPPYIKGDNSTPYFKIYRSRRSMFSIFKEDVFNSVADQRIVDKFISVAKGGTVLSSDKTKGRQGYVFFKKDKELSKYGEDYDVKLKINGKWGNHRLLGRTVAEGEKVKDGVVMPGKLELIEFDKYVSKGHK